MHTINVKTVISELLHNKRTGLNTEPTKRYCEIDVIFTYNLTYKRLCNVRLTFKQRNKTGKSEAGKLKLVIY